MILPALVKYYHRLTEDPESGIARHGFSRQKIQFCVVITPDGTCLDIQDLREGEGKKKTPRSVIVPGGAKPSGAGINPCLLWDNTGYMLGFKPDDEKPERTLESFEAFRKRHLDLEPTINDPEFSAVCRFLQKWNPVLAPNFPTLLEISGGFGTFRLQGEEHFVHQSPRVQEWWVSQLDQPSLAEEDEKDVVGQCLITGRVAALARLHEPKIKGVYGAQSSGASLVSFNLDAFESYGKEQSFNAPVSKNAAFEYATALNELLTLEHKRRFSVGDASVVFWTEKPTPMEDLFGYVFTNAGAEDESLKLKLQGILQRISRGEFPGEFGEEKTSFYLLGLSPNAARISVRFWYVSTIRDITNRLHEHFQDISIARRDREPEFPAVWQILKQTAREDKDIPPLLSGALMRSVLQGGAYPQILFTSVLRRIRIDGEFNSVRAGILKACLNRAHRLNIQPLKKEISMTLDPVHPDPVYHMGRLFAVLEKAQEEALGDINATIKDRFFGAVSSTPGIVFPRLIRLSQHHLGKLEKGRRINIEKLIQEIMQQIPAFASHLPLREQGIFAIGYYHQRFDLFQKKTKEAEASDSAA